MPLRACTVAAARPEGATGHCLRGHPACACRDRSGLGSGRGSPRFCGSDSGYVVASAARAGRVVTTHAFSTGEATHLGRYALLAREVIDLDTLAVTDGSFALAVGDGDTIYGTYTGKASPTEEPGLMSYRASGPVTGGTGSFRGVSGRLAFAGLVDLATGEFSETVSGTLLRGCP
jgi:hypothetical protein